MKRPILFAPGLFAAVAVALWPGEPVSADMVTIMCLGDSITRGYRDADGDFSNDGPYEGYRLPLWNNLRQSGRQVDLTGSQTDGSAAATQAGFDPQHEGHNGWKIGQIAGIAADRLAGYSPDFVLLMVGTNDLRSSLADVPAITAEMTSLIDQILDQPHAPAELLVATVTPVVVPPRNEAWNERILQFNQALTTAVGQRIDLGRDILLVDAYSAVDRTLADFPDGLHPSDTGYAKLADAWRVPLESMIPVPEPATAALLAPTGLVLLRRRRQLAG